MSYILFWTGKRFGNYLIILYIFVKLLYLANVFGQLFLMTRLLGIQNYHYLGFEILQRMATGSDMIANHYFPKVTHCDFKVRELGDDHQYTVQCVLTINIFTEKIYIILWFWFVILTCITLIDLITFMVRNCLPGQRFTYIRKHIQIFSKIETKEQAKLLSSFTHSYLRPDLVLVLKLLATNVNAMVVSELVKRLWDTYLKTVKKISLKRVDLDDDDDSDIPGFPKKMADDYDEEDSMKAKTNFLHNSANNNQDSESKQLILSNSPEFNNTKRASSN